MRRARFARPEYGIGPAEPMLAARDARTRLFVWALRRWLDGVYGQQEVWSHLATRLGPRDARRALAGFETLLALLTSRPRRPIGRRPAQCRQIGLDEAALAGLVAHAAEGRTAKAVSAAWSFVHEGAVEIAETAAPLGRLLAEAGPPPAAPGPFTPPPAPRAGFGARSFAGDAEHGFAPQPPTAIARERRTLH